jgi:hypothetical protein
VTVGQNLAVAVTAVNFGTNVLTVTGATVTHDAAVGEEVVGRRLSTHATQGFRQVEKLTPLSTSCGQGGVDFAAIWNQHSEASAAQSHISEYACCTYTRQPITVGDTEICVFDTKYLLGAKFVGDTSPFTQGDATDVVAWVRIGSNAAIQVMNTVTQASSCVPGARNSWSSTVSGTALQVVESSILYAVSAGRWVHTAPHFPMGKAANGVYPNGVYPSCLDGEYISSGAMYGGKSSIAEPAGGGLTETLVYGYAFVVGSTSITVRSATELFQAVLTGMIVSASSTTVMTLPSTASATAGFYVGYSLTLDLDGNIGTTGDVETKTIAGYNADRTLTVSSAFSSTPSAASLFVVSLWQDRKRIATGSNLFITVTAVNFFTNVLTVSGVEAPGMVNEPVYQTVPSYTEFNLDVTSPAIEDLYVKCTIWIISGKGAGQHDLIEEYDPRFRLAKIKGSWTIPPDVTSGYIITGKSLCINDCASAAFGSSIATGKPQPESSSISFIKARATRRNSLFHCSLVLLHRRRILRSCHGGRCAIRRQPRVHLQPHFFQANHLACSFWK